MDRIADRKQYKPRVIDGMVEKYLAAFGAICIEGPKWCGKTWTSAYHCNCDIFLWTLKPVNVKINI